MRVIVVGAGVGGLTAALAHARQGANVRILEQSQEVPAFGAGLQLGPNAVRVLDALGLGPAISACASAPPEVRFLDAVSGRRLLTIPLGSVIAQRCGAPFFQMHRADLIRVLLEACHEAGVAPDCGAEVARAGADGAVVWQGQEARGDLVIAADGVRSRVATELFGQAAPRFSGRVAWRATPAGLPGDPAHTRVWLAPGAHVVAYPLRGGALMNIVAVKDAGRDVPEDWFGAADPADLCAEFSEFPSEVKDLLARVEDVRTWGLYAHAKRPRLSDGAVSLLGDSAHPMLPFFAQGAAMAIEDAWVHAQNPAGYEAARLERVWKVQAASTRNGGLYHASGTARHGRNLAFQALDALPKGARLGRFDWLYKADVTAFR